MKTHLSTETAAVILKEHFKAAMTTLMGRSWLRTTTPPASNLSKAEPGRRSPDSSSQADHCPNPEPHVSIDIIHCF